MSDFETELEEARELLAQENVTAFHVGVMRDDRVETTTGRTANSDHAENLQALSLLAAHLRSVADEVDAEHNQVAANAAAIAGQFDGQALSDPADDDSDDLPGE